MRWGRQPHAKPSTWRIRVFFFFPEWPRHALRSRTHALTGQRLSYVRSESFLWWIEKRFFSTEFVWNLLRELLEQPWSWVLLVIINPYLKNVPFKHFVELSEGAVFIFEGICNHVWRREIKLHIFVCRGRKYIGVVWVQMPKVILDKPAIEYQE